MNAAYQRRAVLTAVAIIVALLCLGVFAKSAQAGKCIAWGSAAHHGGP